MKKLLLSLIFILTLSIGCRSIVNPNEWVVTTTTCWNTINVSKAGQTVPRLLTPCDRMMILPATPMSGDFDCKSKFQDRVAGDINITYQWYITNPSKFIENAKGITSSATGEDHRINVEALELIENVTVDKLITNIVREETPKLEAGIDELEFEKILNTIIQPKMVERGVEISNISINIVFDWLTEGALGAMGALRFYKANGEEALGRELIRAQAGATNIIINENP